MAQQAVDADVHVVGISSLAGGHKILVPKVHTLYMHVLYITCTSPSFVVYELHGECTSIKDL